MKQIRLIRYTTTGWGGGQCLGMFEVSFGSGGIPYDAKEVCFTGYNGDENKTREQLMEMKQLAIAIQVAFTLPILETKQVQHSMSGYNERVTLNLFMDVPDESESKI
jgi:hypothetical protein